jgi:arylsulfatase A-like enzyme
MELAGLEPPLDYPLDGESLVDLLNGKKSIKRDALFWHFPAYLEAYDGLKDESRDPVFRTRPVSVIRNGDWKLLMFHEEWVLDSGMDKINTNNSIELYNLKKDPGESKNLHAIKHKKRDKLLSDLLEWQDHINAPIPHQANPDYIEN